MDFFENLFINIGSAVYDLMLWIGMSSWWADLVLTLVQWLGIIALVLINILILIWYERKISGFIQLRLGPNRLGPIGLFQTLADTLKLMTKEDIIPRGVDKLVFILAPPIIILVAVMTYVALPLGDQMTMVNLNNGLYFTIAVTSIATIALFMAGWSSNNKYSLIGAMRAVAQMVSYEIPLIFSLLGVVMISGSLNFQSIIAQQSHYVWFIFLQPLAFVIYFISATAELNRGPFDMPEAEQELTAGAFTEYTGMRWALFFLAEYTNLFAVSLICATVFFGGWAGPWLPSWLWIFIKTYLIMTVFMWIKWTFPRVRMDHMMKLCWKILIPLSLLNLLLTGAGVLAAKGMGWM
jgi:NADH-quinone oxidoreductase subunit H